MKRATIALCGFLACAVAFPQTQHFVWSCAPGPNNTSDCHTVDTTVMGGIRFEDYKVTKPSAVLFDPAQRLKELAGLGPSAARTMCAAPPTFVTPAPTITFDKSTVVGQIYWKDPTAGLTPSE